MKISEIMNEGDFEMESFIPKRLVSRIRMLAPNATGEEIEEWYLYADERGMDVTPEAFYRQSRYYKGPQKYR